MLTSSSTFLRVCLLEKTVVGNEGGLHERQLGLPVDADDPSCVSSVNKDNVDAEKVLPRTNNELD